MDYDLKNGIRVIHRTAQLRSRIVCQQYVYTYCWWSIVNGIDCYCHCRRIDSAAAIACRVAKTVVPTEIWIGCIDDVGTVIRYSAVGSVCSIQDRQHVAISIGVIGKNVNSNCHVFVGRGNVVICHWSIVCCRTYQNNPTVDVSHSLNMLAIRVNWITDSQSGVDKFAGVV